MNIPSPTSSAGFRAWLYFLIPFFFGMAKQLSPYADKEENPFWLKWIVMFLLSAAPALIAVRAYYDGSAEKIKQEKEQKKNEDKIATS